MSRSAPAPERFLVDLPAGAVEGRLRRSVRARRLRVTVGPAGIEIVAPLRAPSAAIAGFVEHHREWIRDKASVWQQALAAHPGAAGFSEGGTILLRGERTRVTVTGGGIGHAQVVQGDGLLVALPEESEISEREALIQAGLNRWLRRQAEHDAKQHAARHGPRHGLVPSAIRVKQQQHLWGSCTAKGVIHLNWRLIFAPPPVFEYVVVHELCHLRVRHHGREFWRLVGEVLSGYQRHRRWLKDNGHLLTLRPGVFS